MTLIGKKSTIARHFASRPAATQKPSLKVTSCVGQILTIFVVYVKLMQGHLW